MDQERIDFEHFKNSQLLNVDFATGKITAKGGREGKRIYPNIGSLNPDGYERVWCNRSLRMKHRLIFFLYYGAIPAEGYEIDHIDKQRNNNAINNLCIASKSINNRAGSNRKITNYSEERVHTICLLLQDTELSDTKIAEQTGVSRATVRDIKCRRSRKKISKDYSWIHRNY